MRLCDACGLHCPEAALHEAADGELLWCPGCMERAQERADARYYGGAAPVTHDEITTRRDER
jgi:flavoprotein